MFDSNARPQAPLPGTTPAPRALFIDRWGTLLSAPARGWAETPGEIEFFPGAVAALFRASRAGWNVYLVGNEDAVAYGKLSPDLWEVLQERVLAELSGAGVRLIRDYACLTRPDGAGQQVGDSVYQLPNTGAFYHAAHTDGIRLDESWVIGDETIELVAGWRSGCRLAGVRTGTGLADRTFEVEPEFVAADLAGVLDILVQRAARSA